MGVLSQPTSDLAGLIVPIYETLGATMTATSQAGPKPGGATRTSAAVTALALVTSGTLDLAMADADVVTLEAGGVGRATVRWRYGSENLRSWDPPVMVSGWELIDRSITALKWIRPHVIRQPSTGLALVAAVKDSNTVACWRQDRFGKWTEATVEATGNSTVACLVALGSGRLVSLYVYQVTAGSSQIRMSYSDDGGATWTLGSSACLTTALGKSSLRYLRIRAVELNGLISVLLWEQDTTDTIFQYVSSDGGATLDLVETFATSNYAAPDMAVSNGTIYVAIVRNNSSRPNAQLVPYVYSLASASLPLSSAAAVDAADSVSSTLWAILTGAILTSSECALLADDDGRLWLYGVDFFAPTTREVITRTSMDGGVTWIRNGIGTGISTGTVLFYGDATTFLRDLTVAPERGRAVLVHRNSANATADDSLCAAYLGGWSSVGFPEDLESSAGTPKVAGYEQLWLGFELPQNTGTAYTQTLSGAATSALGSSGLTLVTGAAENAHYSAVPNTSTAPDEGVIAEFHVTVTSGTAIHNVTISDGVNSYSVRVTVTATQAVLLDVTAAAILGTVAIDGTKGVVVRIALDKGSGAWATNVGRVRAWIREDGPYIGALVNYGPRADRLWTQIANSTTLTAGGLALNALEWGFFAAAGGATYRYVGYSGGSYTADNIADSVTGNTRGRILSSASSPIHLAEGLRIHGLGGPTMAGDTWRHAVAYEHPVEAIDPSRHPSPRRRHRSNSDAFTHDITWTGLDLGWRAGDALGILIAGANIGTAALYRDNTATNKVADLDFRIQGLGYVRARGQIVPAPGAAAPFHFSEGSLREAHVDLGGGLVRKVRTNHAGAWLAAGAAGTYPSARVQLESYEVGDPGAGTCDVWMPGGLWVTEAMASTNTLMLRIPAQDTKEDYFELGVVLIGRFRVIDRCAWGRSLQWTPAYALTTSSSGARTARVLGPQLESEEIAWDDGIDTTGIHTAGSAPDWTTLGYPGADAIAARADTPRSLAGILSDLGGATVPVGYARAFQQLSAATTAATPYRDLDPNGALYGRILTETLRVETVLGNEQRDELVKVGLVRFERER